MPNPALGAQGQNGAVSFKSIRRGFNFFSETMSIAHRLRSLPAFSTVALAGDELLLSLITHARHGLSWTDLAGIG